MAAVNLTCHSFSAHLAFVVDWIWSLSFSVFQVYPFRVVTTVAEVASAAQHLRQAATSHNQQEQLSQSSLAAAAVSAAVSTASTTATTRTTTNGAAPGPFLISSIMGIREDTSVVSKQYYPHPLQGSQGQPGSATPPGVSEGKHQDGPLDMSSVSSRYCH